MPINRNQNTVSKLSNSELNIDKKQIQSNEKYIKMNHHVFVFLCLNQILLKISSHNTLFIFHYKFDQILHHSQNAFSVLYPNHQRPYQW